MEADLSTNCRTLNVSSTGLGHTAITLARPEEGVLSGRWRPGCDIQGLRVGRFHTSVLKEIRSRVFQIIKHLLDPMLKPTSP